MIRTSVQKQDFLNIRREKAAAWVTEVRACAADLTEQWVISDAG